VLLAAFSFPAYESAFAASAAVARLLAVVFGFALRPRRDVFYLRTTGHVTAPDAVVAVEHERIAIGVELARWWLLF
jgi:hypothetical protein